jgi:hypothetical protein
MRNVKLLIHKPCSVGAQWFLWQRRRGIDPRPKEAGSPFRSRHCAPSPPFNGERHGSAVKVVRAFGWPA